MKYLNNFYTKAIIIIVMATLFSGCSEGRLLIRDDCGTVLIVQQAEHGRHRHRDHDRDRDHHRDRHRRDRYSHRDRYRHEEGHHRHEHEDRDRRENRDHHEHKDHEH